MAHAAGVEAAGVRIEELAPPSKVRDETMSRRRAASDFANVFKAFIGSNYLGLPFAFGQAGWLLGTVLLVVIAAATDYCCQLIVKCKVLAAARVRDQHGLSEQEHQHLMDTMQYGDVGEACFGRYGRYLIDLAVAFTQFGFCIGYAIFLGNMLSELNSDLSKEVSMLFFAPLFAGCALLASVRVLGPVSMVANVALLVGFVSVIGYELRDFSIHESVRAVDWGKSPVFFGIMTSDFEGIGTVIPIQSSMGVNQHKYPRYLHITIALITVILGSFGILGYLKYGADVEQIIVSELPNGALANFVRCSLVIAISLTYPLQAFPIFQIVERYVGIEQSLPAATTPASVMAVRPNADSDDEFQVLLVNEDSPAQRAVESASDDGDEVTLHEVPRLPQESMPVTIPLLSRQFAGRAIITILTILMGMLLKDAFSYVGAIVGAVGSSALSFIIPPLMLVRLTWSEMGMPCITFNYSIILFGLLGGAVGLYVTVRSM
eukprot:m.44036 g.44036  ORF g.44036 m.44036 type:complete len:490 (+) comp6184_c0_seq1:2677-4146(+)